MGDYLSFRKFITPAAIQVIFWIGVVGIVISTLVGMFGGSTVWPGAGVAGGFVDSLVLGIAFLFLWRVYCELIILWFKLYDEISGIRQNTGRAGSAT